MPLDFRYHLASLAAVFCALVIGLLLGVALKEGPGLRNQITELSQEFAGAKVLRNIDARTDEFNSRTQKLLLSGRLVGRNVLLVSNPTQRPNREVEAVSRALEEAGAVVTAKVSLKPTLKQLTPEHLNRIYTALGETVPADHATQALVKRLGGNLGAGPSMLVNTLVDQHLVSVSGDPAALVSIVVFLGGASEKEDFVDDIDLPFLDGCTGRGVSVAATEPFLAPVSVIRRYAKIAPLTIDNIDHAAGRITLIMAVSAGERGKFGYKDSADDVIPEVN